MSDDGVLCCEQCGTSDEDEGIEQRDCGHMICEECFAGSCPVCDAEEA